MTGRIELPDDKPYLVRRMIRYFYLLDSERTRGNEDKEEVKPSRAMLNAEMYVLADKYEIEGLKKVALDGFEDSLFRAWEIDTTVSELRVVVPFTYGSTPKSDRGLKDCVIESVLRNWRGRPNKAGLQQLFLDTPEFFLDMIDQVSIPPRASL